MKQIFTIICDSAVTDTSGNLYIFGTIDDVQGPVSSLLPRLTVVSKFEDGEGKHGFKIAIKFKKEEEENFEEITNISDEISFGSNKKGQYIATFINLTLKNYGTYEAEVYIDEVPQPIKCSFNFRS